MSMCTICGEPNYLATDAHPCCEFWERIRPGRPCGGCAASRDYWRKARPADAPCHDKIASFRASPVRASSVRAQRPTPTSHQGRWANTQERP